jgi:ABC-2 type transport system permease protein
VRWRPVSVIARKDLTTVLRNRGVRLPLLITPIVILVVFPVVMVVGAEMVVTNSPVPIEDLAGGPFGTTDPGGQPSSPNVEGLDPLGRWAVFVLEVFIAPLFLLVPLVVSTVIAADSFAGERERGTLEALLHTPTTDQELMAGKFLAAWVPALAVTLVGFAGYSVLANVLAWPWLGRVFFPTSTWLVLAFWVSPALAAMGMGVMVIASSRVKSLQAAHQIGSLLVLPVLVLVVAQIAGLLLLDLVYVVTMGAVLWVVTAVVLAAGGRSLRRERLAARL